jgi:antitoxin ParD1/3/4
MPTRNVHLTEHFDSLIAAGIESGQFSNASEVVREGLRLLEQRQEEDKAKIEWLRSAAQAGIDSLERGEGISFHSMDALTEHIRGIGRDARKRLSADQPHG